MRLAVPLVLVACGGAKAPPPEPPKPVEPARPVAKRVPIEDTEPEEGVTIINARGHMEQASVESALAPHKDELSACYMAKVGRRRWLGGRVLIKWDVKKDGTLSKVLLSESDLGAWPVEKCLIEVARSVEVPKPIGGDADFSIPLEFTAKGAVVQGDEELAEKAIAKQRAKLDACDHPEKERMKVDPGPPPRDVTITIYVGPHGKPQSVGFSSETSQIPDRWGDCAEAAVLAWRLPDPHGMVTKLGIRHR